MCTLLSMAIKQLGMSFEIPENIGLNNAWMSICAFKVCLAYSQQSSKVYLPCEKNFDMLATKWSTLYMLQQQRRCCPPQCTAEQACVQVNAILYLRDLQ